MKHKVKRIAGLLLALVLVMTVFVGCNNTDQESEKEQSSTNGTEQSSGQNEETGKGPLPIVTEPLTLTRFEAMNAKASATMKDYNEIKAYQKLEELTGIHIEWIHPPVGQEKEQFNLMLLSQQDLPDMVWWDWRGVQGGPEKAIEDGVIVKLNDLIDQYAPNFKKTMEDLPEAKAQSVLDDGTFYMFPFIRDEYTRVSNGLMLRKDWLDKLNLKVPTTIDEWYTVLTAFKQNDPNGNGKPDEIPFVTSGTYGMRFFQFAFGVQQFNGWMIDPNDGKVKYPYIEQGFKDWLTTMAKWYKEGLIEPDFPAIDNKVLDAKVTGNIGGALAGAVSGNLGRYMTLMKDKDPNFELVGVPWPKAANGKVYGLRDPIVPGSGLALTSQNEHLVESVKWLDYGYSKEGRLLLNFGPEDEGYKMVNDYPTYTDVVMKNPNGLPFDQAAMRYGLAVGPGGPTVHDPRYFEQALSDLPQKKAAIDIWSQHETALLMPPVIHTKEESDKVSSIMADINTYVGQMGTKFIMGETPLSEFDKYVQTIKDMGIDEAMKIKQDALDRYNANR